MSNFQGLPKILIVSGLLLAGIGLLLGLGVNLKWIGRLPGDIYIRKDNWMFYFPLATSVIVSILLTIIFYLLRK